jgi:hypothetical protein
MSSLAARVSAKDIHICLDNSRRLEKDSGRVSDPTRAALLELAIEELGKAATLSLVLLRKILVEVPGLISAETRSDAKTFFREGISDETRAKYRDLLSPIFGEAFYQDVRDAFVYHTTKLEYVHKLNRLFESLVRDVYSRTDVDSMLEKQLAGAYGLTVARIRTRLFRVKDRRAAYRSAFEALASPTVLSATKNRGLYVELGPTGCIAPSVDPRRVADLRKSLRVLRTMPRSYTDQLAISTDEIDRVEFARRQLGYALGRG